MVDTPDTFTHQWLGKCGFSSACFCACSSLRRFTLFHKFCGYGIWSSTFPANKGMASGFTLGIGNTLGTFGVPIIGLIAERYSSVTGLYVATFAVLLSIPFVIRFIRYNEKTQLSRPNHSIFKGLSRLQIVMGYAILV